MNTKNIKAVNEEIIEKTAGKETDNRLKILELFGGIGAPRKALQNIGWRTNEFLRTILCRTKLQ